MSQPHPNIPCYQHLTQQQLHAILFNDEPTALRPLRRRRLQAVRPDPEPEDGRLFTLAGSALVIVVLILGILRLASAGL